LIPADVNIFYRKVNEIINKSEDGGSLWNTNMLSRVKEHPKSKLYRTERYVKLSSLKESRTAFLSYVKSKNSLDDASFLFSASDNLIAEESEKLSTELNESRLKLNEIVKFDVERYQSESAKTSILDYDSDEEDDDDDEEETEKSSDDDLDQQPPIQEEKKEVDPQPQMQEENKEDSNLNRLTNAFDKSLAINTEQKTKADKKQRKNGKQAPANRDKEYGSDFKFVD
jgi:hypothetical protein